jgi:hypothetical protein
MRVPQREGNIDKMSKMETLVSRNINMFFANMMGNTRKKNNKC